jgi:hypothetical protein
VNGTWEGSGVPPGGHAAPGAALRFRAAPGFALAARSARGWALEYRFA